jgi:pSer/pThr/pTyr-binding forkhead associated (FHA) protein
MVGDSGSKNGSFVDGARVANGAVVPVRDGASLRFGDVTAKFWLPKSFCLDLRRRLKAA